MLVTDGFGGVGGIAKFNRDFLQALNDCSVVERVQALPRLIIEPIKIRNVPEAVVYDRDAARGKAAYIGRLAARLFQDRRLNVVICAHINLMPLAWLTAQLLGARLALIIHGIEAWKPPRKLLARRLAGKVDAVISVSRFSAQRFTQWSKVSNERIFILPNCVDLAQFQPQQRNVALAFKYGLHSRRVILTMGRLEPGERYKGFDEVIEIMPILLKRFPDLRYLIVGDGPDRARLETKVAGLGLTASVIFTGYIPEAEKVSHYSLADVYVMPSVGEGFGIVLIEAAACGVPVVGSQADGSREALLDGRLGHLVDPTKPNELIRTVAGLLARAPARKRMDGLEIFSMQSFKARVADWCRIVQASSA
jgi:glycosyltransferase involved in cell wall biosynthesis